MTTTATGPGCPVDESFDPLSPEFLADPYTALARRPGQGSRVFFAPSIGYYVVTSYAAIDAVFRDPGTYSAAIAQASLSPIVPDAQQILLTGGYKPQPSMVSLDEPEHARLRKPAARAFSMKRVTAMIPTIEATTTRLLNAVAGQTEFNLVATLAFPLPANIVFSLMGVPEQDYAQVKQWCGYRAALSFGRPAAEDQVEIATTIAAYRRYMRDLVDSKVHEPGDDLASDLIAIHREAPERLTLDEISSMLFSLSFAGHETTTGLIGNTVRCLLEDPGRWADIVRRPDLIPAAVEESLRYDPSVAVWRRVTTRRRASSWPGVPVASRPGPPHEPIQNMPPRIQVIFLSQSRAGFPAALRTGAGSAVPWSSAAADEELVVDMPCMLLVVATLGQTLRTRRAASTTRVGEGL